MSKRLLSIRGIAIVRAAAVVGCLVHSASLLAITLREPEPDPWFSVWVQVEAKSLPPGVEFKRASFPGVDPGYFSNSSSTPFYLVTAPSTPPNWVRDLPATVIANQMAVSGNAFRMDYSRDWSRENFPEILIESFLKRLPGHAASILEMDAYLGNEKIVIRGRLLGDRMNRRLELDSPLPAPLRLTEVQPGRFAVANDGPVPLYTGIVFFSRPVGWVTEVPFGFLATHKLVAGKTYYGATSGWEMPFPADGWSEARSDGATLTDREFETYLPGFKFKQIYRDNRPGDAKVPGPQPFRMTAFYGTRKITVRGRILYDLNPNYDPHASQRARTCASCTGSMCDECAKHQSRRERTNKAPKHSPNY